MKRMQRVLERPAAVADPGTFVAAFQPIVEIASGRVFYHEALARFPGRPTNAQRVDHILSLERAHRIHLLDAEMLARCVGYASQSEGRRFGVNISGSTIDTVGPGIAGMLERLGGLGRQLVLEITESAPLTRRDHLHSVIRSARRVGCEIAFDDFGAGWFTPGDIEDFRPDIVKLDGSFVRRAFNAAAPEAFEPLVSLAARNGALLVAEHVECAAMSAFVASAGIRHAQGFFFGPRRRHTAASR